jgi:hypothetical protein
VKYRHFAEPTLKLYILISSISLTAALVEEVVA